MKKSAKRIIATSLCALLTASALPFAASASERITRERLPLEREERSIFTIDFSREPSEAEKRIMLEHYQKESELFFNETYAKQVYERDQAKIAAMSDSMMARTCCKEFREGDAQILATSSNSIGTVGDILVSYTTSSLGIDLAFMGHAAIVASSSSKTIESYPESDGHENGVRVYTNDWKKRDKVYGLRVSGATMTNYRNAAQYAQNQADAKKPYNWNFFNKGTTEKFYCSQLVWRAWKEQGFDIDRMNLGNWEPVSPAELVGGSSTYTFYYK